MVDAAFAEYHHLFAILHKPLLILMHTIHKYLVVEVFLHFGDIYNPTVCQFFKFCIVDISPVKSDNLIVVVMAGGEHEGVVGSRRGELYITWDSLVGMDDRVDLDASFLLSGLWMPSNALENSVGEKRDCSRIDNSKPFNPLFRAIASAVR